MKVLSTLQVWTTPLWLILMVAPFAYLLISHPESVSSFFAYQGEEGLHKVIAARADPVRSPGRFGSCVRARSH